MPAMDQSSDSSMPMNVSGFVWTDCGFLEGLGTAGSSWAMTAIRASYGTINSDTLGHSYSSGPQRPPLRREV